MMFLPEQYRHFGKNTLLWKAGQETAQETFEPETAQKDFENEFFAKTGPELANRTPEEVAQEVGAYFEENFFPKQYEAGMAKYLESRVSPEIANRLLADSVARYTAVYKTELAAFYRKAEARISDYEGMLEQIKDKIGGELGQVNEAIQNVHGAEIALSNAKELTRDSAKRLLVGELVPALGSQYFNLPWQEQHLSERDFDEYGDLSDDFQAGMVEYVEAQLDFILNNSQDAETLKARLEGLREETVERYRQIAKENGFIDLAALRELKRQAGAFVDLTRVVNSGGNEEEIIKKIEGMDFLGRDHWAKTSRMWANEMVETVRANGTDQAFIETIQKISGKAEPMTFGQAADTFMDLVEERAKVGIRETLQIAREVNMAANGRHAEILKLEEGIPDSIRPMVDVERVKLINRITIPKNVDDRLLVDFIREEREGRDKILSSSVQRLALFQAVKNVLAREQDQSWSQKIRSLPKKTSELTTGRHPEKPTGHDEIARFLALIVMAKEAEATFESLDRVKEYQGQNLLAGYEEMEAEKKLPNVDMRFRDINKLYSTRYVSEVSRAGFNGKSIGLGLLALWLGATALVNAKKAGLKGLHKNPFFLGAAAGLYGLKKYKENPEFKNYFSENAGGQERIVEQTTLNSLARKVGRDRLIEFITDGDEFAALESLTKEDPKEAVAKLKAVREKAKKRYGPLPIVTKEDLKGVVEDKVQIQLAESGNLTRERTRYLFYEAFMGQPRNIRELKENCQKWLAK